MKAITLKCFFCCIFPTACSILMATGPAEVLYITENYAPSNYVEEGELKGVAVELLKAVWAQMGVDEQPILVYPWARGYQMVLNRPDTLLFAMTRTDDRESLFKWVGPIYRGRYSLIGLSTSAISLASVDEIEGLQVGVIREDLGAKLLEAEGFGTDRLHKVSSIDQLVQMLEAGRLDLICVYEDTIHQFASREGTGSLLYETKLVLTETVMYYAFNKETEEELVVRFQQALEEIDDQRRVIVERYQGSP